MANDDHGKSRTPQTDEGKRLEPKKGFERLSDADRALIAGAENTGDPSPGPTGPPVTVTANPPPPSPPLRRLYRHLPSQCRPAPLHRQPLLIHMILTSTAMRQAQTKGLNITGSRRCPFPLTG